MVTFACIVVKKRDIVIFIEKTFDLMGDLKADNLSFLKIKVFKRQHILFYLNLHCANRAFKLYKRKSKLFQSINIIAKAALNFLFR